VLLVAEPGATQRFGAEPAALCFDACESSEGTTPLTLAGDGTQLLSPDLESKRFFRKTERKVKRTAIVIPPEMPCYCYLDLLF